LKFTKPSLHYDDFDGENTFEIAGDCTTIGRSADQDLVLKEAFASRRHATITRQNGGFEVIDQNSSHGTYLNGKRIDRAKLRSGDTLQFGSANAVSSASNSLRAQACLESGQTNCWQLSLDLSRPQQETFRSPLARSKS